MTDKQPSEKAMKEAERFCHEASESGKHHESGVCHSYVATILDDFAEAEERATKAEWKLTLADERTSRERVRRDQALLVLKALLCAREYGLVVPDEPAGAIAAFEALKRAGLL